MYITLFYQNGTISERFFVVLSRPFPGAALQRTGPGGNGAKPYAVPPWPPRPSLPCLCCLM